MPGQTPLPEGTTLDRGTYLLESLLGQGGFGLTYRAQDAKHNRLVAIKEFYPDGCARRGKRLVAGGDWDEEYLDEFKNSFLEECRILTTLKHPGIVRVHRFFLENNTLNLVMECIEGQTLSQYQRAWQRTNQSQLPIEEVLRMIRQASEALSVVHESGLLHRDLKPGNLMRRTDGQVVLIDFGAAREVIPDRENSHTQVLTAGYAPPEQYPRRAVRGPYTDVYALAATLYKLLTGETPTEATLRPLMGLPAPRHLRPEVPEALSSAVMWGMELKAEERPQTIKAFLEELFPPSVASASSSVHPAFSRKKNISSSTFDSLIINAKDDAEMIFIPAGEFLAGSQEEEIAALLQQHLHWKPEWFDGVQPRHSMMLDSYYIYKTPVTVAQFRKFCEASRGTNWECIMPPSPSFNAHWLKEDHPIVNVSSEDAMVDCQWAEVSLPTEAQWEKAARGTDGRQYPWGNQWDKHKCQCSQHKYGDAAGTSAAGSYPDGASPYGILDMAGNVWEWCADWFDNEQIFRVLRGGAWIYDHFHFLFCCSYRFRLVSTERSNITGFRCVSRANV